MASSTVVELAETSSTVVELAEINRLTALIFTQSTHYHKLL